MFEPAPPIGVVLLSSINGDRSPLVSGEAFDRMMGKIDLVTSRIVYPVLDRGLVATIEFDPGTWN